MSATAQVLTETPVSLGTGASLDLITVHNTDADDAAYVKVYDSATTPDVETDTPAATYLAPAGESRQYVVLLTGSLWIACAQEALAGDTAPTSNVIVSQVSR
jgi:hypothetical protein